MFGQSRARTHASGWAAARPPLKPPSAGPVMPYDLAATFKITGRPGNLLQDVINVSTDSTFVAVGIGYGFEEDRESTLTSQDEIRRAAAAPVSVNFGDIKIKDLPLAALMEGFRVNPKYAHWIFPEQAIGVENGFGETGASESITTDRIFGRLLQRIKTPTDISFLISLIDTATGREFQDQPAHNLASLGKSNGERPFRALAKPFTFAPRSTLRIQITERTEGVTGTLFVVLYGYRLLGAGPCPEPVVRSMRGTEICPEETIGNPNAGTIPFDYVSSVELTGRRGNIIEDELPISADGGFVATSIGYGLAADQQDVRLQMGEIARVAGGTPILLRPLLNARSVWTGVNIPLGDLPLRVFPVSALLDGIRIKPGWLRLALDNGGRLANAFSAELLDGAFERINRPVDVSFRYAITDTGTGREMQNQRLNNIAGLGIANGDRPFKPLPRSMVFLPRSTIRLEIEELFGRGQLYIAFHGYKLLHRQGASR